MIWGYLMSRKEFYALSDVVLLYDKKYGFNCRLLQAFRNEQEWPALPDRFHESFCLKWQKNLAFVLMTVIIIAFAQWIPISAKEAGIPINQPTSWGDSNRLINQLEEDQSLDQQQIEKFREKLKELQEKEAEEWYKHTTLEASGNLLNSLSQTSQEHQQNLLAITAMLDKMEALKEYLTKIKKEEIFVSKNFESELERILKQLEQDWDDEMKELMQQYLKINKEFMNVLKGIQPSAYVQNNHHSVDKETLKKWLEEMKKWKQCNGSGSEPREGVPGAGLGVLGGGLGGEPLGDEASEEFKGGIQTVHNQDMQNMDLGELLGTSIGEHDIEKEKFKGKGKGGDAVHKGHGGDTVWRDNLLPEEQEILRSFNK